jgi:cupin superfamily acireductone dioxygenase involved in methionine salvage
MSCHTFARLVLVPRDTAHWRVTEESHRVRFARLSDEQYAWMFTYLKTNLNDVDFRQKLPDWVKDLW